MKSGLVLEGMAPPWEQLRTRLAGSKFRSRFKLAGDLSGFPVQTTLPI